jgi:L-galactose dehydrogenase
MKYRTLGRTGLNVSLASLGTGGPSNLGQRKGLSQLDQTRLIRRALDLGINFLDTSAGYGESESILGRALEGVPRDNYVLATKWRYDVEPAVRAQDLINSVDQSLLRTRTEFIDVMQFHGVTTKTYSVILDQFYPVLKSLQSTGKIRYIGFSEQFVIDPAHEAATLALKQNPELWDTIMLKYGILNQYASREALPLAMRHNVGIINMAAVRIKLPDPVLLEQLIAEWKDRGEIPTDSVPDIDPLGWLIHDGIESVVSAAYKFAADHPAITTVLTGTANIEHLADNVATLEEPVLPSTDKRFLVDTFGHIAEYA